MCDRRARGYRVDENSEATHRYHHDQMMSLHDEDTETSRAESERIARRLIAHAELPLVLRVHAHMILAAGDGEYLWHANEAVRVAKRGIEWFGEQEAASELLAKAEAVLSCAIHDDKQLQELKTTMAAEGVELVTHPEPGEELPKFKYGLTQGTLLSFCQT